MKNKRANRAVLITGSTSGIGRAMSEKFASEGWDLICHYHASETKIKDLKERIIRYGVEFNSFRVDFLSKKEIARFLSQLKKMKIDSLINNAGTYVASRHFKDLTADDIIDTFMVNTFAPMMIASSLFAGMEKRSFGRIVNISSISAKYGGSSYSMHYGASKRALEGLTKTLAKEGSSHNILVNTIRPGVIDTEFHKRFPKDMDKRIAMIPMKRMGTPEDVAEMAYYLGSDRNNFITKEIITIAGGE